MTPEPRPRWAVAHNPIVNRLTNAPATAGARGYDKGMSQEIRRRIAAGCLAFPRFSRGVERAVPLHVGRFSDGHEALPEHAAGKDHVGRFSDGHEALPDDAPGKEHVGLYSDGAA
jgi:hypothetical protein